MLHYTIMTGSIWIIYILHSWLRMAPHNRIIKEIIHRKNILHFYWNTLKSETFDSTLPCTPSHLSWLDAKSDHSEHSFYMGMGGYSRWKQWRIKPTEPIMQTIRFTKPRTGLSEVTGCLLISINGNIDNSWMEEHSNFEWWVYEERESTTLMEY